MLSLFIHIFFYRREGEGECKHGRILKILSVCLLLCKLCSFAIEELMILMALAFDKPPCL